MSMKGFIVQHSYKIIGDNSFVILYGRLENGESFASLSYYKPYFFIKAKDLEKALRARGFEYEKTSLKNFNKEEVVKVFANIPKEVPSLRKDFEEANIECFEADIPFSQRFLIDNSIQGCVEIEGEYNTEGNIDRIYKEPELKPCVFQPNLKVFSFDIETNAKATEVYSIAFDCSGIKKVFTKSAKKLKGCITFKEEEDLLDAFKEELLKIDPDVITGWNVIDFDLNVLQKRFKKFDIPFALGRDNSFSRLRIETDFFRTSKAEISGRIVIDALALLKTSFIKVHDYKLGTVAKALLGEGKLIEFSHQKPMEIDKLFKEDPEKLAAYNLKDAELVIRILEKSKALDLTIQRSLLTGMELDRVGSSIASLDSLYIREARKRGIVVPSGKFMTKEKGIKGGFVMEPKPGIYDYVIVLDFKSLYPSIIRTFNIDPASFVENCKGKNLIKAPNGACFKNEEGILPSIIAKLWEERAKAAKEKNDLAKHAIKILMNSMFGVMATPNCRFFNLKIANAITHFGQAIIKGTAEKIKEMGYDVIYMDTDSCFLVSKAKKISEAENIGKEIAQSINKFYEVYIKENYGRKSSLELQFDKCFSKFLMPRLRKEEAGAKKRYAGITITEGKEKLEVTGLESVRGDWTELAKNFQLELLERIFHNKEVMDYIKKVVNELREGKLDNLLVYRKSIRKGLDDYTKTTPPHVRAARLLDKLEGNLIEYVITEEGPEPIQKLTHKIDYEHYIEKQLKPIADSILAFFNLTFDDLIKGSKQTTLFGY